MEPIYLDDDLEPIQVPIFLKKGEKLPTFILLEADGDAVIKYRNATLKATRYNEEGLRVGFDGLADAEPLLVSLCLYYPTPEGKLPLLPDGKPDKTKLVPEAKVRAMKNRSMKPLFETVQRISDMEDVETEESLMKQIGLLQKRLAKLRKGDLAKNEQSSTTTGFVSAKS